MSKSTSLQRLLSLDKTYETLDQRIDAAAQIIDISLDASLQKICPLSENFGRVDYVFRWITTQLKSSKDARYNPLAWKLTHRILQACPTAVSNRLLSNISVVSIIAEALAELFPSIDDQGDVMHTNHESGTSNVTVNPEISKKSRKRKSEVSVAAEAELDRSEAFLEIATLFKCHYALQNNREINRRFTVKSGTTDGENNLRFMRYWLHALIYMIRAQSSISLNIHKVAELAQITEVHDMWKRGSQDLQSTDHSKQVINEITKPSLILRRLLMDRCESMTDDSKLSINLKQFAGDINKVISKAIISPALAQSLDLQSNNPLNAQQLSLNDTQARFEEMLSTTRGSFSGDVSQNDMLEDLLRMCTNRVTASHPKDRRAQSRWVETMFLVFNNLDKDSDDTDLTTRDRELISRLVDILVQANIELSTETLKKLLAICAINGGSMDEKIDFDILAAILASEPLLIYEQKDHLSVTLEKILDAVNRIDIMTYSSNLHQRILVPLIKAATTQRYSEYFIDSWLTSLERLDLKDAQMVTIWHFDKVSAALSTLMSAGLNVQQISSRLLLLCERLESPGGQDQTGSSFKILDLFLNLLRNSTLIDDLKVPLMNVLDIVKKSAAKIDTKSPFKALSWNILDRLHLLLHNDWADEEIVLSTNDDLGNNDGSEQNAIDVAQKTIKKSIKKSKATYYQDARSALSYVYNFCVIPADLEKKRELVADTVEILLDSTSEDDHIVQTSSIFSLIDLTLSHAFVWSRISQDQQRRILKLLAHSTTDDESRQAFFKYCMNIQRWHNHKTNEEFLKTLSSICDSAQSGPQLLSQLASEHILTTKANVHVDANKSALKIDKVSDLLAQLQLLLKSDNVSNSSNIVKILDLVGHDDNVPSMMSKLSNHEILVLVDRLLKEFVNTMSVRVMNFVHLALANLNSIESGDDKELVITCCRKVFASLVYILSRTENIQVCHSILKSIIMIYRDKEKRMFVSQYGIENTIKTLHGLLIPSTNIKDIKSGYILYHQICMVVQQLLQSHRRSLTGRLHLFLPLLIQLLSIQYTPHRTSQSRRVFNHPPWLFKSKQQNRHALSANPSFHTTLFSRLLTLLCTPSPSTLGSFNSHTSAVNLVDKVRKSRLEISEFISTVMHAFCSFELSGRLVSPQPPLDKSIVQSFHQSQRNPRDALNTGLYAIFDIMDMASPNDERIIALAASMSKSQVAILRKEHGEWKRFGRWKNNEHDNNRDER